MDVRNCRKCGKIFNYVAGQMICPACKEANEKKFQEVKDYIRENKTAGIADICRNVGVSDFQIEQWIREERLVFDDDSPVGVECQSCGTMIKSGKYCDKCKNDLARGLMDATRKPVEEKPVENTRKKTDNKMRFLH